MSKRILFILSVFCLLQTSCDIINPAEKLPTYVHIDSFKFVNPYPNQTGTGIQNITSAWVFLDGKNVGVFELPADIPVLVSGTQELQISPGIDIQGFKDYKVQYPFFSFYTYQLEDKPGEVIKLAAETKYVEGLKYWTEDFESGNQFIHGGGDSLRRTTAADSVLEGGGSGRISLPAGEFVGSESLVEFDIKPGTKCFLEINYKGTLPFTIGLLAVLPVSGSEPTYLAGVKAKDSWGKFYVDLQPYTTLYPTADKWYVMIKTVLEDGESSGYLLLDNIKVISY